MYLSKPTLYILCGPSGCGKSTYAKMMQRTDNVEYVSRDEIRFSLLKENEDYFAHEDEVFNMFVRDLGTKMMNGHDVIADATHITRGSRVKLTRAINRGFSDYFISYIWFDVPVEICLEQNNKREGRQRVPDDVIRSMCQYFQPPTLEEDYRALTVNRVG